MIGQEIPSCDMLVIFQLRKEREQRLLLKRGGSLVSDSNGKISNGNTNPKGISTIHFSINP